MTKTPKRILFTRNLNSEQVEFGTKLNCLIDHHTFIRIDLCQLDQKTIDIINSGDYPNWIFTSQNAVRSLMQFQEKIQFDKVNKCYAVGEKTAELLKNIDLTAEIPQRQNAEALSHLLEEQSSESFLYFTGNLRQDTLINFFEEHDTPYQEIKVYETHLIQPEIDLENYDAICFCSPSAVHSFFKNYQLKNNQPCFAIGYTTAAALVDYSDNVMLADQTNVYALIQTCNQYLNS